MDNFTPLKPIEKKKKKINKFLIFGNLFLVILVALIGIFYYNQTLLTTQQKAYEHKQCSEYGSPSECDNNCSPYKNNGQSFFCNWSYTQDECKESSNICEAGGGGGGGGIIGGTGCTRIDQRCFNCSVTTSGEAWHNVCNYIPITGLGCPNASQGPSASVNHFPVSSGTQQFCFDGGPNACGSEQIDYGTGDQFISRIGPEACGGGGGGSTPTPTPPTATNTPTPTRTPTPTQPIMSVCNETCSSSDLCFNEEPGPNELVCTAVGGGVSRCRNKACTTSSTCICPTSTPTRTPTPTPTRTPTPTPTGTLTPTPTGTLTPTPTNTPGPSATPIPVLCGTKDCDNATNPCRTGYNCVQANDGSNYCTSPDFTDACKANPSYNSCCTAPGAPTATPTEIVLAQTTVTSPPVPVTSTTAWWIYIIPTLIIFGGLIL